MPPEISNSYDDGSSPLSSPPADMFESEDIPMYESEAILVRSAQAGAPIKPPQSPTSHAWVPRDASPSTMARINALEKKEKKAKEGKKSHGSDAVDSKASPDEEAGADYEDSITVKAAGTRRRRNSAGSNANLTLGAPVSTGRGKRLTPSTSTSPAPGPASKPKPRALSGAALASANKRKRAEAMKWETPFVMTDEKSPLGDANLRNILLMPRAWDVLTAEEKQSILAKMPDATHVLGAGTPEARPNEKSLRNDNNFRHDCTRYTENIRLGKHDEQWLREAWAAREKRKRGGFDAFEVQKFERDWGVSLPQTSETEKPQEQEPPPRANMKIRISRPQRRPGPGSGGGDEADDGPTGVADPAGASCVASGSGSGDVVNANPTATMVPEANVDASAGVVSGQGSVAVDTTSVRLKRRSDDEDDGTNDAGRPACVVKRRRTEESEGHDSAVQEQTAKEIPGMITIEGDGLPTELERVVEAAQTLRVDGPRKRSARAKYDGVRGDAAKKAKGVTREAVKGVVQSSSRDAAGTAPSSKEAHQPAGLSEAVAGGNGEKTPRRNTTSLR